jgi:hypothetical protein
MCLGETVELVATMAGRRGGWQRHLEKTIEEFVEIILIQIFISVVE